MNPETVLITGSNRGIGLGLVRQFINLQTPPTILIAACRDPDNAKTAVNMFMKNLSIEYKDSGILFLAICPSTTNTDMIQHSKKLLESMGYHIQSLDESCGKLVKVMSESSNQQQGMFLDNNGEVIPW